MLIYNGPTCPHGYMLLEGDTLSPYCSDCSAQARAAGMCEHWKAPGSYCDWCGAIPTAEQHANALQDAKDQVRNLAEEVSEKDEQIKALKEENRELKARVKELTRILRLREQ